MAWARAGHSERANTSRCSNEKGSGEQRKGGRGIEGKAWNANFLYCVSSEYQGKWRKGFRSPINVSLTVPCSSQSVEPK